MKTTLILTENQTRFLAENRQDPITQDDFSLGDEIVFCAECKSAFLKESWEYMGLEHCNQDETLNYFPHSNSLELKKAIKKDAVTTSNSIVELIYFLIAGVISIYPLSQLYHYNNILFFLVIFGSCFLVLQFRNMLS